MISSILNMNTYVSFLCTFLVCKYLCGCSAKSNITTGESIHDGLDHLESPGKKFQMGFFPHKKTPQSRYVGIWYTMDPETIVWVANRDNPVPDSTGVLKVEEGGDVKVLDKDQKVYYSMSASPAGAPLTMLMLLDSGNAALIDVASGTKLWESFNYPTDTFLPGMKMDMKLKLTSWKNENDPGTGRFIFQLDPETKQGFIILNGSSYHWKSGSGSRNNFELNKMFPLAYYLLSNTTIPPPKHPAYNGTVKPYNSFNNLSRLLMNYTGSIQYYSWVEGEKQWDLDWQEPQDACSIYGICGSFGLCSLSNDHKCSCLDGFEHVSSGSFAAGCRRTYEICLQNNDKFINLPTIYVENPSLSFTQTNESECMRMCLESCQCQAYSYKAGDAGIQAGCWIWNSELKNFLAYGTQNISIRVSKTTNVKGSLNPAEGSPFDNSSSSSTSFLTGTRVIIFGMITLVILWLCSLIYIYYKRRVTGEQERSSMLEMNDSERRIEDVVDLDRSREEDTGGIGVPFFELRTILAATDNFSDANKLGQGGFGPVYKLCWRL